MLNLSLSLIINLGAERGKSPETSFRDVQALTKGTKPRNLKPLTVNCMLVKNAGKFA